MLMMCPRRRATMSGSASWHAVSTPYRFTSIAERIDCSDCSRNGPIGITPALLISTSMWPPPSVRALSRNVANDPRSVTSSGYPDTGPQLGQLCHGRLLQRHVPVSDHDACATLEQGDGGGVADAPCRARDGDGPAADVVHAAELYTCQVLDGRLRSSVRPAARALAALRR